MELSCRLLCLTFRERNEAFRQLARELRFRWNEAAVGAVKKKKTKLALLFTSKASFVIFSLRLGINLTGTKNAENKEG